MNLQTTTMSPIVVPNGDMAFVLEVAAHTTAFVVLPDTQSHVTIRLIGDYARVHVRAALHAHGDQQLHHTIDVQHLARHTVSRQVVRALASDAARCTVHSHVHIHKGAVGSDSQQSLKGLLLNAGARHDLQPSLSVFEDDVKCSHGATTGNLEWAHILYMRQRGLSLIEAKQLLVDAFLHAAGEDCASF